MKSAVYCLQVKSCWTTHSSCLTTFSTCQEVCGYPDNQPRHLEVMLEDCWCWNRTKLKLLFQKLPSFTLLRIGKKDKGLLIFSYRLARRRVGIGKRIRGPHFSRENPHLNPISHFSGPNSIPLQIHFVIFYFLISHVQFLISHSSLLISNFLVPTSCKKLR